MEMLQLSAKCEEICLNDVLMTGPDLTNSLLVILLRFRKEPVAITADIEQMFYRFCVREDHKNFLRFFWPQDNDLDKTLIEYRMCVHVFGNSPSPAIATYSLRKTAEIGAEHFGIDTKEFVEKNFYVDDGVTSLPSSEQAVNLLERTQQSLKSCGNLRLHKIASNNIDVMNAFSADDLGKDLRDLDLGSDTLPIQRSLGLTWDLESDVFTFRVSSKVNPYTRRGVLSTVNSLFDPMGFAAPVTIQGKILLRELITSTKDWDEPLPPEREADWDQWRNSVKLLESLHIQRTYVSSGLDNVDKKELHIFSDASETAIAAVAYLLINDGSDIEWKFVFGKTKLAPLHGHTIPCLELCAAVLAVEILETLLAYLDLTIETVRFYTDSKIVRGYIHNQTRRFCVYVTNRVSRIRKNTNPEQWSYLYL